MRSAHRTKGSVNKPISMHTDPPPQPSSLTCVAAAFAERAQARTFAARAQAAIQRRSSLRSRGSQVESDTDSECGNDAAAVALLCEHAAQTHNRLGVVGPDAADLEPLRRLHAALKPMFGTSCEVNVSNTSTSTSTTTSMYQ